MSGIRKWLLGGGLALLSAFLFGLADITVKASADVLTIWHMLFGRGAVAGALLALAARRMGLDLWGPNPRAMILTALINVAGVICLMVAIVNLPIFQALVLLYLYPALAALLSIWLLKERTSRVSWFFIALAFGGTALILWPEQGSFRLAWGHVFALASAMGMGLAFTLIRRYSKNHHASTPVFYFSLISLVAGAGPLALQKAPLWMGWAGLGWLLAMSLLAAAAQYAVYKSLASITSSQAGTMGMTEVVWGSIWGYLIFQEAMQPLAMLGAALVLGGGVCLNLGIGEKSR